MAGAIEGRLSELGIELPEGPAPVANYVPYIRSGSLVFIAGQIPLLGGELQHHGILGQDLDIEQGAAAARLCALNVLAQVKAACDGDLDRIVRCVRLGGYVSSTPEFGDHPKVMSDKNHRHVQALLQFPYQCQDLRLNRHIQGRGRLVGK